MAIEFTVPMKPTGKGRPIVVRVNGRSITYTPVSTARAEGNIKLFAWIAGIKFLDGPVGMEVICSFRPPSSMSKKRRAAALAGEILPTKRPDVDNICKLCADALNGIGYHDDAQIVDLHIIKKYGESDEIKIVLKAGKQEIN